MWKYLANNVSLKKRMEKKLGREVSDEEYQQLVQRSLDQYDQNIARNKQEVLDQMGIVNYEAKKYADKKLLVEINNCRDITILDDSYEGKFTCTDGHIVKSKSETIIDNWLFDHNIPHAYEKKLPIDANENHDLHPDFCLPGYGDDPDDIYIEYWGYNESNVEYTKSKNYKMKCYKQLKVTVICLQEKDIMDINASMTRKLKFYKKGTINE